MKALLQAVYTRLDTEGIPVAIRGAADVDAPVALIELPSTFGDSTLDQYRRTEHQLTIRCHTTQTAPLSTEEAIDLSADVKQAMARRISVGGKDWYVSPPDTTTQQYETSGQTAIDILQTYTIIIPDAVAQAAAATA